MGSVARSLFLTLALGATACADGDPEPTHGTFLWVGGVAESDIAFAAVSSTQSATLFFCGGPDSLVRGTHWLPYVAPLSGDFSEESSGVRVRGSVVPALLQGTLEVPGERPRSFSAVGARLDGLAGLYEGIAPCGHIGLIVFPEDAEGTRAQGTCVRTVEGEVQVEQVNPVMPLAALDDRGVAVEVGSDPQPVIVRPVVLAE
ncbi:MAG TPA: hypothetical protein VFQ35_26345 [Polyangiaceae bacterium]|nr:hypothetical protein [Polyangiaceae bacterium]